MKLLDLFCGAGGAAVGYHRAGFDEIVGVDCRPMPRYPFTFVQGDALAYLEAHGREFDAIHASPPCQKFTQMSARWRGKGTRADEHQDWLTPTRAALSAYDCPTVIENVQGARWVMHDPILLHGGMFGLGVHRPRLFESRWLVLTPYAARAVGVVGVYGDKPDGRRLHTSSPVRAASSLAEASAAMGIDWMTWEELREAIPPAFTEWIGRHLMTAITARTA